MSSVLQKIFASCNRSLGMSGFASNRNRTDFLQNIPVDNRDAERIAGGKECFGVGTAKAQRGTERLFQSQATGLPTAAVSPRKTVAPARPSSFALSTNAS